MQEVTVQYNLCNEPRIKFSVWQLWPTAGWSPARSRILCGPSVPAPARTQEVTVQYNLCNEPRIKYSMAAVADRGLKPSQ